ncbi:MAG: AAA family ATPase [Candidatus Nanopelagicales bacterium]
MNSLSMLVHGPSKAGKSLLTVSTPSPRVLLDVEAAARFLPIKSVVWDPALPPPTPDGTWDTAVVQVRRWTDATMALKWLQSGQHPFRSVGLDSVSELQARYLEHIAGRSQVKLQDWGAALRELRGFVSDLRDLTFHQTHPLEAVVVTSMTGVAQDGRAYPWLQGQMKTVIPYLLDVIAYIDVIPNPHTGLEERFLYTRKTAKYLAGERVGGRIPPVLQLPVVDGNTIEEIAAKNTAYIKLIELVYALHSLGISAPAVVDTAESPFAYHAPQPETETETETETKTKE